MKKVSFLQNPPKLLLSLFFIFLFSIISGVFCIISNDSIIVYLLLQIVHLLCFCYTIYSYKSRLKFAMMLLEEKGLYL